MALCNQLPDLRYKFVRNVHNGFGGFHASLVFEKRVLFSLVLITGEHPPDLLFIPSFWQLLFAHWRFLLLRLRNAASGLPVRSYAVITKTLSGWGLLRIFAAPSHYSVMIYQRRLPHISTTDQPVFLTWRLHGSLPPHRPFAGGRLPSGRAFAAMDRLLDEARTGPFYLRQPALADMVVEAFLYNAETLRQYVLHAFAVMPNHVHLSITAAVPLSQLTKSIKGITAKRANRVLALTGRPFWQEESYDHVVRHEREFETIRSYIEENPVRAGLASVASEYPWSSAGWATRGSPADRGVRIAPG